MNDKALNDEGRELWDGKATFWDNLHGDEGNNFHRTLISPSVERLLDLQAGEQVLDIGCGNGVLARRLAALGADVTAVDFSTALIALAKKRGQPSGTAITYGVVDATDEAALLTLGVGQFDAIVCTMALMDMPTIQPMYRAIRQLLSENGRFVFAISHPAFNSNNPIFVMEMGDEDGEIYETRSLKIRDYLDIPPVKGAGARDEPNPHYYYHRPLHELLNAGFEAGLVLDGIEEVSFPPEAINSNKAVGWDTMTQIPPVLAGRFRLKGK